MMRIKGKFGTNFYRKTVFSGACTNFNIFLRKAGLIKVTKNYVARIHYELDILKLSCTKIAINVTSLKYVNKNF